VSQLVQISDAAYQLLQELAAQQGQSPEATMEALITSAGTGHRYYETEDWFRHLGVSEERIRGARELADSNADT
jgi:hypothetical protein